MTNDLDSSKYQKYLLRPVEELRTDANATMAKLVTLSGLESKWSKRGARFMDNDWRADGYRRRIERKDGHYRECFSRYQSAAVFF